MQPSLAHNSILAANPRVAKPELQRYGASVYLQKEIADQQVNAATEFLNDVTIRSNQSNLSYKITYLYLLFRNRPLIA